ncbi:MAG TPA: FAD-dependent oxidoreductase [Micromonosporaceae bacterium]|nr:FAD-dependent oxidoreductase [Micromonosporaceae bacterium]
MSFWLQDKPPPRPGLTGRGEADVVIIGGGFTALWTAYYLSELAPDRSVLILEAEHAGWGASGRNGGWCTTEMPTLLGNLVVRYGPMAAMRFYRAAGKSLDEIEKVLSIEGIDASWQRDGSLYLARNEPQRQRLLAWQEMRLKLGINDMTFFEGAAARERLNGKGVLTAGFTPNCATVHPARIAFGLAAALERRGVVIAEGVRAVHIGPGRVQSTQGDVRSKVVLLATEAYSGNLNGHAGRVLPVVSRLIATEPLPDANWQELGWHDRMTVADSRYQFAYFQRTADNRLIAGGRGVGYRAKADSHERVFARLRDSMVDLFPALHDVEITHRWSGEYGLHRDSEPAVVFDPATGMGHAGGYGGEGVALSNLAGRTLAALVTGQPRPETKLCWVNHRSRRWEPEPLRRLGVHSVASAATWADNYEDRTGRVAPLAGFVMRRVL